MEAVLVSEERLRTLLEFSEGTGRQFGEDDEFWKFIIRMWVGYLLEGTVVENSKESYGVTPGTPDTIAVSVREESSLTTLATTLKHYILDGHS